VIRRPRDAGRDSSQLCATAARDEVDTRTPTIFVTPRVRIQRSRPLLDTSARRRRELDRRPFEPRDAFQVVRSARSRSSRLLPQRQRARFFSRQLARRGQADKSIARLRETRCGRCTRASGSSCRATSNTAQHEIDLARPRENTKQSGFSAERAQGSSDVLAPDWSIRSDALRDERDHILVVEPALRRGEKTSAGDRPRRSLRQVAAPVPDEEREDQPRGEGQRHAPIEWSSTTKHATVRLDGVARSPLSDSRFCVEWIFGDFFIIADSDATVWAHPILARATARARGSRLLVVVEIGDHHRGQRRDVGRPDLARSAF